MRPEVRHYPNLKELSQAAAGFILTRAEACVRERRLFTLVLSGGTTPRVLYEELARPPYDSSMPWADTHLFWGDERCVPPNHPDSNFAMTFHTLISQISVPPQNIHRIPAEIEPPDDAAEAYEKMLRAFFPTGASSEADPFPSFDLILLGVGADGHTASLFPGGEALEEGKRWVAAVPAPNVAPSVPRITLTLPVLNRAEWVFFLVSGSGKKEVVRSLLEDPEAAGRIYPAARVRPRKRLVWLLDAAA